jgi:hypothetical protein
MITVPRGTFYLGSLFLVIVPRGTFIFEVYLFYFIQIVPRGTIFLYFFTSDPRILDFENIRKIANI